MKFAHNFGVGSSLKINLQKFFHPTPIKIWRGKKLQFAELLPTRRQSEAHNFKAAQHIDKQKLDVSSTINALKWYQTWGVTPWGCDAT